MKRTVGLSIDADEHRIPIKIYGSLVWPHECEIWTVVQPESLRGLRYSGATR